MSNDNVKLLGDSAKAAIVDQHGDAIKSESNLDVTDESQKLPKIDVDVVDLTSAASVPEDSIILSFGADSSGVSRSVTMPVHKFETDEGVCESVSSIMPVGEDVLVAEHGMVGIMELATGSNNLKAAGYVSIVGKGDKVPSKFKLGMHFIPKMMDTHVMRHTFDPQNQYSFEMLLRQAKDNKEMLAAVTIAGRKDQSRVGLRMDTQFIDPEVIKKAESFKAKKNYGPILFKDDKVEFLNYRLMHFSNISAIVL